METVVLIAPITALEFFLEDYLLKGEGPILTVFSLRSRTKATASIAVLQHYRIHGVRPKYQDKRPQQNHEAEKEEGGSSATEPNLHDLAVFGGKAVRLVRLVTQRRGGDPVRLEAHGPLIELRDWVLDLRWLTRDGRALLGVALAHNSVLLLDPHEGITLARCSCLDGCLLYSALLLADQSWDNSVLVGGTVFNQLVLWRPNRRGEEEEEEEVVGEEGGDPERKAPVERRLLGHGGVIFSICYLREKGWLASASDDRSVRVWGVGALGGPGPTCGDPDPACLAVLYGHQARVFSVHLSPGKVYSAGEDGCCLVWDWSRGGGAVARTLKGHRAGGIRALAVSEGREEGGTRARRVATGGADGGVRLWRVEEEEEEEEEGEEAHGRAATAALTDLKFSGRGTPKGVCAVEDGTANWARSKILACTDQGAVYQGCCAAGGRWDSLWQGDLAYQSYCVMEVLTVTVKSAAPRKAHLCAVGNLGGGIHVFDTSHPRRGLSLRAGDGKINSLVWVEGHAARAGYLLASGSRGLVHRWRVEARPDKDSGSVLIAEPRPPFALPPCAKRWLTSAVRLRKGPPPGALWVCGDRRGSLLLFQGSSSSRRGGGGVEVDEERKDPDSLIMSPVGRQTNADDAENEKETNRCDEEGKEWSDGGGGKKPAGKGDPPLQPLSCLFGVHGKQGVTSVCEHRDLLYSAGRDGCVRVFRIRPATPQWVAPPGDRGPGAGEVTGPGVGPQLEVLRVQRACKGMEWLERVLFLTPPEHPPAEPLGDEEEEEGEGEGEGGGVEKEGWRRKQPEETNAEQGSTGGGKVGLRDGRECRFVIAGFQAVNFVVWDPVRQERLLTVPCSGGHRSWILWPPCKSSWPGYGALVFIKHGAVVASQPPRGASTSAGVPGETGACGLREGVHGKGIGCVCRLGRVGGTGDGSQTTRGMGSDEGHWEVLVTGGEDTSLTVLAVRPSSGTVQVLSVITDHISNVRTLAAVADPAGARPGQHSLSALLVSAGGRAQMQCYRLLVGWDEKRREPYCQAIQVASHRLDEQWEKRRNRHKTVKADPETRYMSIEVVNSDTSTAVVALACSDGAIRLFSISEVKGQFDLLWESFYHRRCVLSVAPCCLADATGNRYRLLLSAATDGRIALWDFTPTTSLLAGNLNSILDTSAPPAPCLTFPAHQSGVNSLAVWQERTEDGCLVTVASGGDDGQLTLSVVKVRYPELQTDGGRVLSQEQQHHHHHQLLLSQADLTLLSQSRVSLAHSAPVTALSLLSRGLLVSTSPDQRVRLWRVCGTGLRPAGALYSHVADAAGLAAWGGEWGPGEGDEGWVRADPGCESRGLCPPGPPGTDPCVDLVLGSGEQSGRDGGGGGRAGRRGWVVVCGQGLQLLHVRTSSP